MLFSKIFSELKKLSICGRVPPRCESGFKLKKLRLVSKSTICLRIKLHLNAGTKISSKLKLTQKKKKRWNDLISDIVNKSEFLLMMQTPVVFKSEPNEP
jgi:hypothetical protein